jgi:signal transduction histidine kinase
MFDTIFGQPSARVVAVARVGLAAVFYLGTMADPPIGESPIIIPVLAGFLAFAIFVAVFTWNDWWIDARIALVTHAIDVGFFVIVVGSPQGYSSSYFLFFVFLLLSPAIRWTWRETAATAAIVIVLYVFAGLLLSLSASPPFETRRFIIRSGYLLILSIVLIWFGVRRRFSAPASIPDPALSRGMADESPFASALRQSMELTKATHAIGSWTWSEGRQEVLEATGDEVQRGAMAAPGGANVPSHAFLFDARRDRALLGADWGAPQFTSVTALIGEVARRELGQNQGIGIPIEGRLGQGLLLLWGIKGLHSDHLALCDRLHSELPYLMERRVLLSAMRDGAIARERVALARDLHDGIVQFLAGSAYKIEAISRSPGNPPDVSQDLQELKQLMLLEQEDLRSSIGILRTDKVSLEHTGVEAAALCKRLARQWHVRCRFESNVPDSRVPARLHMDLLNMIKESVANAVRHASATEVQMNLTAKGEELELAVRNDIGSGALKTIAAPWSIRERITELGGSVTIETEDGATIVRVSVPLPGDGE